MLGLTSYQEALRALGRMCEPATQVRIVEQADLVCVEIGTDAPRSLSRENLEEILLASHARRGEHRAAGPLSDILRAVGAALDQLHARGICLELSQQSLRVRFSDERELSYAGEELEALRHTAAARRKSQPRCPSLSSPRRRATVTPANCSPPAPMTCSRSPSSPHSSARAFAPGCCAAAPAPRSRLDREVDPWSCNPSTPPRRTSSRPSK